MRYKIKHLFLSVVCATFCSASFANSNTYHSTYSSLKGEDLKNEISTPELVAPAGIMLTLEALAFRPDNLNLKYAQNSADTLNFVRSPTSANSFITQDTREKTINPTYKGGFRVGLGYVFPNRIYDIQLNWTHFKQNYHANLNGVPGEVFVSPFGVTQLIGTPAPLAPGADIVNIYPFTTTNKVSFDYDAVDFDGGRWIDMGRVHLRLYGGLRAAYINKKFHILANARGTKEITPSSTAKIYSDYSEFYSSKFKGIGPRFGVDPYLYLGHGFSIAGTLAGSLLMSSISAKAGYDLLVIDDELVAVSVITNKYNIRTGHNLRVTPAIDAKLGVNYTFTLHNINLSVEGGYRLTDYIDASDTILPFFSDVFLRTTSDPSLSHPVRSGKTTNNVSFAGPYFTLTATI